MLPILLFLLFFSVCATNSNVYICTVQKLPVLRYSICRCLHEELNNRTVIDPPSPAPSPALKEFCEIKAWNGSSWCICRRIHQSVHRSTLKNASHTLQLQVPHDLNPDQIVSLFPHRSQRSAFLSCSVCACPEFGRSMVSAAAPSPVTSVSESLCICSNCTAPGPAKSPVPNDPDEPHKVPDTLNVSSLPPGNPATILRKQPPPRVVITNVNKMQEKLLAYVLPVTGFVLCVLVFFAVLMGRSILSLCRSSASSTRFSHLDSEI